MSIRPYFNVAFVLLFILAAFVLGALGRYWTEGNLIHEGDKIGYYSIHAIEKGSDSVSVSFLDLVEQDILKPVVLKADCAAVENLTVNKRVRLIRSEYRYEKTQRGFYKLHTDDMCEYLKRFPEESFQL